MTISYPLSLPSSGISKIRLTAKNVIASTQSIFTGQRQVQAHDGQWWEAQISLAPQHRADAETWFAFLLSLKGQYGTFLLGDPAGATPRGIATGTPAVNGDSQTGGTLSVSGATPSITGWLKAGDYISLGTGESTRLYKVLKDADSDGSGLVSLDIWPNLRTSPSNLDTVTVTNAKGAFQLTSNAQDIDIDSALIYGISFAACEAL